VVDKWPLDAYRSTAEFHFQDDQLDTLSSHMTTFLISFFQDAKELSLEYFKETSH